MPSARFQLATFRLGVEFTSLLFSTVTKKLNKNACGRLMCLKCLVCKELRDNCGTNLEAAALFWLPVKDCQPKVRTLLLTGSVVMGGLHKLATSIMVSPYTHILERSASTSWCNAAISSRRSLTAWAPASSPAPSASRPIKKLANTAVT